MQSRQRFHFEDQKREIFSKMIGMINIQCRLEQSLLDAKHWRVDSPHHSLHLKWQFDDAKTSVEHVQTV
jgi:hypothetical protein